MIETAILEIRPGAGGNEAALFAGELLRMYFRFSERRGWPVEIVESQATDLGGLKYAVLRITGENAYGALRHESGVHRVQRIPETEKSGRIHTSTATVAVLPEVGITQDFHIPDSDLQFDSYRSGGKGGQNVNRRETAVRLTHIPTGISVACQEERSQFQNRERALKLLKSRLLLLQREQGVSNITELRRLQVGSAERSDKIRTYNFPQDRITDHRIKKKWHNIAGILDGNLDKMVRTIQDTLNK